jgi:signal peptidase I
MEVEEFIEELPHGFRHSIYKFMAGIDSSKVNMKSIIVPYGSYYVLGDNRDNSIDSRYIGCIKREDITGHILYTYWGNSRKRININLCNSL